MADLKLTLKAARVNTGLTQEEAAEKSGIGVQRIKKAESGIDQKFTVNEMIALCNIYCIDISDLKA